jgi:uncharacterized metal-binding protein YceD (DUF177 family)
MRHHREFQIAWLGLKEGMHEFQYEINDEVLEDLGYAHPDFENLDAKVSLKFEKHSSFFMLHFDLDGHLDAPCDRCGDNLDLRLWDEFNLVIKLTDSAEEADRQNEKEEADVHFMPRSETVIDVSSWIFEFIMLSIPIQKIHPDREDGSPGCNPEALKLLEQMKAADHDHQTIWKDLDQFKN